MHVAAGPLRLALPDHPSIDDPTSCSGGRPEGSVSFVEQSACAGKGMIGDDKDFFREGLREVEGH